MIDVYLFMLIHGPEIYLFLDFYFIFYFFTMEIFFNAGSKQVPSPFQAAHVG